MEKLGGDWGDERDIDSGPEAYPDTNPRPPPRAHEHDVGIWTEAPTEGNTKGNASSSSSSAPLFRSSVVGTGWVVTRWTDGQEPESWAQTEDGGWLKHNCNIRGYMERSRDHPTFARGSDLEAGRAQSSPDPSPHCYKCGTYVTCKPGVTFHCHLCNRAACRNCTRQEEFVHGDGMFSVRVCDLCPTPAACQEDVVDNRLERLGRGQNAAREARDMAIQSLGNPGAPPWEFTFGQLHLEIDDHADAIIAAGLQDDGSQRVEEFLDTRRYMFWALAECIESKRRYVMYREAFLKEPEVIPMPPTHTRWRQSNDTPIREEQSRRSADDSDRWDSDGPPPPMSCDSDPEAMGSDSSGAEAWKQWSLVRRRRS